MESKINIFNNKKILITGGGGYLGSKLAERIINTNAQIYLCDLNFNNLSLSLSKNVFRSVCSVIEIAPFFIF